MLLFDLLHDYQHLRAKAQLVPLEPAEALRLEGLTQLLRGDPESGRRQMPRFGFRRPLRISVVARGLEGFVSAGLRELGAEGAALEVPQSLPEDRTLILYFDDEERCLRFEIPAVVVWQARGHAGVRFEGMPSRRELVDRAA